MAKRRATKRAKKQDGKNLDELAEDLGADKIEVIQNDYKQRQQQIVDLLDGKVKPNNEFVAYMLQQMRETVSETKVTQENLAQVNQRAGQLQQRLIELRGIQNQMARDILSWQEGGDQ